MNESKNTPKVSVVIPTYNRGDLIGETIRSLQDQDFEDFEVIIVDDGSTDHTATVCEKLALSDQRIHFHSGDAKNRGPGYCRNKGADLAKGEFLIFLDSDDLFLPGALSERVEAIEADLDLDFIVFIGEFFEKCPGDVGTLWNMPTHVNPLLRFIGEDVPWQTSGPIWRKEFFDKIGRWDDTIVMGDDQELHTRALMAGAKYRFSHKVDYALRRASGGESQLGHQFSTKDGILSQVARVKKLCGENFNIDGQQLETARKLMAGSLLLRSDQMLKFHDDKDAALAIWKIARQHHLIGFPVYTLGRMWIKHYKKLLGDIAACLINQLESDDFLLKNRALLATTPVSCLDEDPYDGRFHKQESFVSSALVRKGLLPYMRGKLRRKAALL